jgi:hypothetical protein
MKKILYTLSAVTVVILVILGTTMGEQGYFSQPVKVAAEPAFITEWGSLGGRTGGYKVSVDQPGSAAITGDTVPVGSWATIRGGFTSLTATESQAVVVKGVIEFIGAGPETWSALRYGLFRHDSIGTLVGAGTDTAKWNGKENNAYGYLITPPSGTNDPVSWATGGNGTHGLVNNGSWISTNSPGGAMGVFRQKPTRAVFDAGKYDFAISVRPISAGVNELKYYMVKQHAAGTQTTYWLAGTDIDSSGIGSSFNGIAFGLNPGNGAETSNIRGLSLSDVTVELTDPIDIPDAPFTSFYVSQWGSLGGRTGGWRVEPGEFDGNVSIVGDAAPAGSWATIRGGFGEDVSATDTKAITITGVIEFIGAGPETWSALRYGLFRHDSAGTLVGANTDTAKWDGRENYAYGYLITPPSGTNDPVSWATGGNGTHGLINNGSWISTNSPGGAMGVFRQKPARAVFDAGKYDFAISVRPIGEGVNELRYYMVKQHAAGTQTTYWLAGTDIDSSGIGSSFNGIAFGLNPGNGAETSNIRGLSLSDVKVDLTEPLPIPEAPFTSFYVSQWGSLGGRTGGWRVEPGEFDGNVSIVGDTVPVGSWATIRGGFEEEVSATDTKAITITGVVEFIGAGPETWSALRYGLFRHDSAGTLVGANTDTAKWDGRENYAYGYMITPPSGTNDPVSWANGGNGTHGLINGGSWISTNGAGGSMGVFRQKPARAVFDAGKYDFAISVRPIGAGVNELRYYMVKQHATGTQTTYWLAGTDVDSSGIGSTFNGIAFGLNPGNGAETSNIRGLSLSDVKVDLTEPLPIPEAPFTSFYVSQWGSLGGRTGGWRIVPGEFDGNVGVEGDTIPLGSWATVRGGFDDDVTATTEKAIIVTGKIEFKGSGPQTWSGLRYGLFRHDSIGTLVGANTDTAKWDGRENYAYGYMITPHSGTNDQVSWANGGNGTHGVINGGSWVSSNGPGGSMGVVNQKPARAEMTAGVYDWAISVQPKTDGSNELRFFIVKEAEPGQQTTYYTATIDNDPTGVTSVFNGIAFGLDPNYNADYPISGMYLSDVKVDRGDPFDLPTPPFSHFYVAEWGFLNDKVNEWTLTPGEFDGNVDIAGNALTTGVELRGQFTDVVELREDTSLVITGKMELVGGGFEAANSLLLGLVYSDSAGTLDTLDEWSGNGISSGYLFIPVSGTNAVPNWGQTPGTFGGVVNSEWANYSSGTTYVLSANQQQDKAVGAAGTYDFEFSFTPKEGGTEVRYYIYNSSYQFGGIVTDNHSPAATTQFNSINFALNNSTTTGLNLADVHVDLGSPIDVPDDVVGVNGQTGIPTAYALSQNYPNPFNPTTTIEFAVPKAGNVSLIVYDALGRKVTELVQGSYNAGYYKVNFNASNYASGVYFYRITAGDFVSVKKLMLLK